MGLFGGSKFDKAFREYEMPKEPNFWQGGEKFRAKDGIAALLAAIGDGLSQANGGQAWATRNLAGGRFDAMEEAKKRAKEQEQLQQSQAIIRAAYGDLTDAQVMALATNNGSYGDFKPPSRKGLRPVAGPTGVFVWDADNERFAAPQGGIPGSGADEWEDIDEETARRLGGGTGNGAGGFRYPR